MWSWTRLYGSFESFFCCANLESLGSFWCFQADYALLKKKGPPEKLWDFLHFFGGWGMKYYPVLRELQYAMIRIHVIRMLGQVVQFCWWFRTDSTMGFITIFHHRGISLSWKVVENHRGIVLKQWKQWKRSKYVCVFNWLLVMVSHFSMILVVFCLCIDVSPLMFLPPQNPQEIHVIPGSAQAVYFAKDGVSLLKPMHVEVVKCDCIFGSKDRVTWIDLIIWVAGKGRIHQGIQWKRRMFGLAVYQNVRIQIEWVWLCWEHFNAVWSAVGSLVEFHMCSVSCSGRNTDWWV